MKQVSLLLPNLTLKKSLLKKLMITPERTKWRTEKRRAVSRLHMRNLTCFAESAIILCSILRSKQWPLQRKHYTSHQRRLDTRHNVLWRKCVCMERYTETCREQ